MVMGGYIIFFFFKHADHIKSKETAQGTQEHMFLQKKLEDSDLQPPHPLNKKKVHVHTSLQ